MVAGGSHEGGVHVRGRRPAAAAAAETLIEASRTLAEDLPATRDALASGVISYRHAQVIMEQAWGIRVDGDPEAAARARAVFEEVLVPDAEVLTVAKLADRARRVRERTHP
ncbi:DUF222 domain-containing protein, partial [Cryobacterium sp. MDB1-18-2]